MAKLVFSLFLINSYSIFGQAFLFKNFRVIDGTGNKEYLADVRIRDNEIALIGNLIAQPGEQVIEGSNHLILAPGFIDTHSHHDRNLNDTSLYKSFLCQGITTLVFGQDGFSEFPLQNYFIEKSENGIPVNLASFIGHNTIRFQVLGNKDFNREASDSEIRAMRKILSKEMNSGALGLSTGLEYDPGIFSSKKEVLKMAITAARKNGMYASHLRSEDIHLEEAISEIIRIGEKTKLPVQISHIKVAMKTKWGLSDSIIQVLNAARARGVKVTSDIYPYDYWHATMEVQFPKRDFDNKASAEFALKELTPPDGMIIARFDAKPDYIGKSFAEISKELNMDPADTYMFLIKLAHDTQSEESVMGRSMTEYDIQNFMKWPFTNICTDGFGGGRHPRGVGSFPRVIHHYVFENHTLTLEEAIHKMTWLSAQNMGIKNRGKISQRFFADLVVIDPDHISDHATLSQPNKLSTGIDQVWVNGKQVWSKDHYIPNLSGVIIRNSRYN